MPPIEEEAKMSKKVMIEAILTDMYKHNSKDEVDRRFKGWLNRQTKGELEIIMANRNIARA